MSLEHAFFVSQIVASVAIAASLIFVGLQVRDNTTALKRNEHNSTMEQLLQENAWASFHIWDRTQRGVFPAGTFELTGGALLSSLLRTSRGSAWWRSAKHIGFIPAFVADVDALLEAAPKRSS